MLSADPSVTVVVNMYLIEVEPLPFLQDFGNEELITVID